MAQGPTDPRELLRRALERDRIHSGYLLSGAGETPRATAEWFARALACASDDPSLRPCEGCPACFKSRPVESPPSLGTSGKDALRYRHVGEHPDLFWIERPGDATRVRIEQVRALQNALRLGSNEGGRRVAVIADAEWLGLEAQNALLKLVEEPPAGTSILLVARSASAVLPTIRSRCIRVTYPSEVEAPLRGDDAPEDVATLAARLDGIDQLGLPELLEWAEEYRGARAVAAAQVDVLLSTAGGWLRERTGTWARDPAHDVRPLLDAFNEITRCQRDLAQRNANPQMVAERSLFAVREALAR